MTHPAREIGGIRVERTMPIAAAAAAADDTEVTEQLQDIVKALPAQAVKDLLSVGACGFCVLRLFGCYENVIHHPSVSSKAVATMLREVNGYDDGFNTFGEHKLESKLRVCKICFGVLDFVYRDEKGSLLKKDSASDFAKAIAETVKQEYSQIDGFSLEVSVPPLILENEQAVWSYLMEKHGSVLSVNGKPVSNCLTTKDALKLSIVDPLQKFLDVKSVSSSFRIRLTYAMTEVSATKPAVDEGCKRRKVGDNDNAITNSGLEASALESSANNDGDHQKVSKSVSKELGDERFQDLWRKLDKVILPCSFTVLCSRTPIYLGGRYLKYSRNVSQTRWIIEDERMGEASVEEIIGGNILPLFKGDSYKFHAAGREDIDVRMLGTGRPFLVEIQNPRLVPFEEVINEIQTKINSMESNYVKVKNLKVLGDKGWDLMREGEAEKQKQYAALVWISRPLNDDDLRTLSEFKDLKIVQKTPVRVLHRRSPLEREKVVHWMKVERIIGSSQHFLLHLCTQAGTYIKEFVHGDLGRTLPSIGTILGCRAEILQLDVTDVKMDCF